MQTAVDACLGYVCTYCEGACYDEQHHKHDEHEQIDALRIEVACSLVNARAQSREVVLLSHRLVVLHEQHTGVVACHES